MTVPAIPRLGVNGLTAVRLVVAVAAVAVALPLLVLLAGGSLGGFATAYRYGITTAGLVLAAALAVAHPLLSRRERLPWALFAAGIVAYALGQLLWTFAYTRRAEPPLPAVSDAFWLAAYLCWIVTFTILARRRGGSHGGRVWLDAIAAGAGLASVVAVVAFGKIIGGSHDLHGLRLAVHVVHPLVDVLLVALIIGALALEGWRFDGSRLLLGGGAAILAAVDTTHLVQHAQGRGAIHSALLGSEALAFLAMAAGAWAAAQGRWPSREERATTLLPPIVATACAVGVLVYGNTAEVNPLAISLATIAVAAALGRTLVGYRTLAELARSRQEALTDELTGLANRRMLFRSLEQTLASGRPSAFALLDLDGFKGYNDRHGHLEGDRLLERLGEAMAAAVGPTGAAYRLGGDEFCILVETHGRIGDVLGRIEEAVARAGDGSDVGISWGTVLLPDEATDADTAIGLADSRMYAVKGERATSVRRQTPGRRPATHRD